MIVDMDVRVKMWRSLKSVLFVFACLLLSGCGSSILYSSLDEKEANEMIAILKQYGIQAKKALGKESCSLSVSNNDFSSAVNLLESQGYPLPKYQTIGEVFKKSGLVSSPLEERVRFMNALSEGIALTLSKIPGVLKSRVHIVLPENDPYVEDATPSSAAVFIAYRQDSLVEDYVREIKYLVKNSIEGLDYDKVSVALFPVTLPPLPKAVGKGENIISIAGMDMTENSKERFFALLAIFSAIVFILLAFLLMLWFSTKKRKQVKNAKIDNLADIEEENFGDTGKRESLD